MEHHWFEPSRMHLLMIFILFFSRSNCKLYDIKTITLIFKTLMLKLNPQKTISNIESSFLKKDLPVLKIGDNVKIGVKIIEGNKERVQFYEGTILSKKNSSINTTITVRKILQGIGIERVFLIHSPKIDSISVLRSSKVRRAKLYYLRDLKGKAGRLKQKFN
jgi:large subunit ribosomal protein L19